MTDTNQDNANPSQAQMPLTIHAQYIKDVSFENPHAPDSLRPAQADEGQPEMQVNVNMTATPMQDKGFHEVVLSVEAKAKRGNTALFIAEIQYGVVCSVGKEVSENNIHPILMIEAPKLAFPFVRQILCDLTIQAGYPPLMLNPVDFEGMYIRQYQAEQANKNASQATH